MTFPKLTSLAILLALSLGVFTLKTNAQEYDLDTSLNSHWPMPNFDKPDYKEQVPDPSFGTPIIRVVGNVGTEIENISGESWRNVARHGYSVRQPWNADESVLYLGRHRTYNSSWGPSLFLDGETYEPISAASEPSGNEHRWHPSDRNLRLILRDNSVISWNYQTGLSTTLMTFNGYSNTSMGYTGNWSDDGNKIAMSATRNSDGHTVVFALDTQTGTKYPDIDVSGIGIDYVSISPLGNYILINANFGQGSDRTKIYDLNGNQVGPYWSEYGRPSHFDMAIDQNGDEVAVGVDKSVNEGRVIKRRLADGQVTVLTQGGWAIHTSARALGRPGWAFASTSPETNWGPYLSEIIAIKLDGSRVERICHARNSFSDYQNEAHPCPSPSGNRVIFATDWGVNNLPIQSYVADFRGMSIGGISVNAGIDQAICEGDEITLTATGADNYLWSNGETTSSITVSPTVTTTYTVLGSDTNGNQASDTVTVTVNSLPNASAGNDHEICEDDSVTLTASGGGTYSWSTGAQSQSIIVSPTETTTYTVTVTLNGCSSSDDVTVTVRPRPTINAGNDVDLYLGESTTLTAVGDGAIEWNTGETTNSIIVSPTTSTTYTVTSMLNGCTNSDSVYVNVIQQNNVTANAGEDVTICFGQTVTLTASGGIEYLWNTGETTQSISVTPSQTSTYTVTVSDQTSSDTDDVTVFVNLLPSADAGEDQTIENGNNVILTASGGNSYLWNTGETTQSISVNPSETTVYTVEAFINGCSDIDDVIINVVEPVNANAGDDVEVCIGDTVILTATGGIYYTWSTGETTSSISVTPNQTEMFYVEVSNGITSQTDDIMVIVGDCSSEDGSDYETQGFEYIVFPNPSRGEVNVKLSGLESISSIAITDMLGKSIYLETFDDNNGVEINKQYNLSHLSKGLYLVRLNQSGKAPIVKKLIIR